MKTIIKLVFSLLITAFFFNKGVSQITLHAPAEKKKEIKLISPLDLLYDVSESKNISVVKYKSIFDANKLPLFCKIEHKLSKNSNVNLRMRLGSLDYVNKLEGKN